MSVIEKLIRTDNLIKLLSDPDADVNIVDKNGREFRYALVNGYRDIIELLLDHGVDPNIDRYGGIYGMTPLMLVSKNGHMDIVELLLDRVTDQNITDIYGRTALIWASINGHREIVELLLDRGSDPNIVDNSGHTVLMWSSMDGHREIVELLLDRAADPNIVDKYGKSPLMWASKNGHRDIVRTIKEHTDLQNALQNLALSKSMNTRPGYDSSLQYLDYDIMKEIMIHTRKYNHSVYMRMKG